ncbi:MAG: tRNA lysidine(34) synthetase TilS [Bacteroidales bacterium]|nr:tRNA lysidine(34) synthetase TilS [Bacteroidales bacterium]NLK81397.1 tRNA lysidine(34) synthetase TilS [Bacteroidales bacterium]
MNTVSLLEKTQQTIETHDLCSKIHDSIIVGVSGGVDSIVLTLLLQSLGYSIAIAHCNFNLRDAESDEDEMFVRDFAKKHQIPLFVQHFNTVEYAQQNGISIEMAARDLRYSWFHELCDSESCTKIAIAHNQNDTIETFFIHLFRTTGLKGLCGIPIKNQRVIRPLLEISRQEIEAYAQKHAIAYRHDSTNSQNIYIRNRIRNQLLPLCADIQENSIRGIYSSMQIIQDSYALYKTAVDKQIKEITSIQNDTLIIEKKELLAHKNAKTLLFEIMHPYGFHADVIMQLFEALSKQSGKQFKSKQYSAIIDRDFIFVEERKTAEIIKIEIPDFSTNYTCTTPFGTLQFEVLEHYDMSDQSDYIVFFDKDELQFPLYVRTWREGDNFIPFGMNGRKKVSDLLIDKKTPIHKKNAVLVVESNDSIIWVVGHRRSHDAKIANSTKHIVRVRYSPQ